MLYIWFSLLVFSTVEKTIGPSKRTVFIKLPYIGMYYSKLINKILQYTITKHKLAVNLRIIFQSKSTIGSLFPLKDRLPNSMMSHVVYRASCLDCKYNYIGMTSRLLLARAQEHKASLIGRFKSSIGDHVLSTGHNFDFNNFEPLITETNNIDLATRNHFSFVNTHHLSIPSLSPLPCIYSTRINQFYRSPTILYITFFHPFTNTLFS
jgi:hypothetical protein